MKKILFFCLLFLLIPAWTWGACVGPSYADVNTAVQAADPEETIEICAGSATWDSTLAITKGVHLKGAGTGVDGTIITKGSGIDDLITYVPNSDYWSANYEFEIEGIKFITNETDVYDNIIDLNCGCATTRQTKIIIHDCLFEGGVSNARGAIYNYGCGGVIYQNTFDSFYYPTRIGWGDAGGCGEDGSGRFTFKTWGEYELGVDSTIYFEDNILTNSGEMILTDGDEGGSYVIRYNTITYSSDAYPFLDLHGGRGSLWGSRGGEVYGNLITSGGGFLISHRGGVASVHHNNVEDGATVNLYNNDGCPPEPYGDEQHIHDSYHFLNREGETGSLLDWGSSGGDECNDVVENSTFWMDNSSCIAPNTCDNITEGIGAGTLANRPTSCTTGTAYWATDQGECADLTGYVGAAPGSRDAGDYLQGTLYRCVSTNTWEEFYTLETYPHPLRGDGDTTPPTLSSAMIASNGTTLTLVFDENVTQGTGYNDSDWDIDASLHGDDISVTYSSGDGTDTHAYTISETIFKDETVNIDFNGDTDSEEDDAGNDLAAIASGSVTNNSTEVPDVSVTGGDSTAKEGDNNGTFTIGCDKCSSLAVTYAMSGTAVNGVDYSTLSGSVTITDENTDATVTVTVTDDSVMEHAETATLTLQEGEDYDVDSENDDGTVTIYDNETGLIGTSTYLQGGTLQ